MEDSVENCENEENLNKDEKSRRRVKEFKIEVGKLVTMIFGDVRYDKARYERRTDLVKQVMEFLNDPQSVLKWLISIMENMNSSHDVRKVESTLQEIHEISPDNIPLNEDEDLQMKVQKTREELQYLEEGLKQKMAILERMQQSIREARSETTAFKNALKKTDDSILEMTEKNNLNQDCPNQVEGPHVVDTGGDPRIPASSPINQKEKNVEVQNQQGFLDLFGDYFNGLSGSNLSPISFDDCDWRNIMNVVTVRSARQDEGTSGATENEANVKLSPDETCIVQGYKVFKRNANALDEILQNKPNTVKNFRLAHQDLQSPFMNSLAEVYLKVKKGREEMLEVEDIEGMELMIQDMEHTGLQLTWLKEMLAEVRTKLELGLQEKIKRATAEVKEAKQALSKLKKKPRWK